MKTIEAIRSLSWDTKLQLADALDIWGACRIEAVDYLDDTQPPGSGISSSDVNHTAMAMLERELCRRLERT